MGERWRQSGEGEETGSKMRATHTTGFGDGLQEDRDQLGSVASPNYEIIGDNTLLSECIDLVELGEVLSHIAGLIARARELRGRMEDLAGNMANATPTWEQRDGKGAYLRLVYPTDKDGKRRRVYIGNKKEKIEEALQRIENYKAYHQLYFQLQEIEQVIRASRRGYECLKQEARFGYELAAWPGRYRQQNGSDW